VTKIRFAAPGESDQLAMIHASSFPLPWSAYQIERMFVVPGTFALLAHTQDPCGMIMLRAAGGQADLLTLAVHPEFRRQGIGRQLMAYGMAEAQRQGVENMFLEVAEDNNPARHLYDNFGFKMLAHRKNYYTMPESRRCDALLMGCPLTAPLPPVS
jgi:ribosomal-protein-alanine N-acetyltransferase